MLVPVLVHLIVLCIVLGLIWYLVTLLPIPAPFNMIIRVAFIIIAILLVLSLFEPGLFGGMRY